MRMNNFSFASATNRTTGPIKQQGDERDLPTLSGNLFHHENISRNVH